MTISKELHYTLNYKPFLGLKKEIKNENLIYCKNFFLFFLILDNMVSDLKKKNYKLKISKIKKYSMSYLRSPNKYKKAQVKITLVRYNIIFKCFKFYDVTALKFNIPFFLQFINFLFTFINFFESALFTLKKKKISVSINPKYLKNFFEL